MLSSEIAYDIGETQFENLARVRSLLSPNFLYYLEMAMNHSDQNEF